MSQIQSTILEKEAELFAKGCDDGSVCKATLQVCDAIEAGDDDKADRISEVAFGGDE